MWFCHHRKGINFSKKQLIEQGEYWGVEAKDLIFVRPDEHLRIHNWIGKASWIRRKNISIGLKRSKKHFMSPTFNFKGKHHTKESKQKIGEASSKRTGMNSARIKKEIWKQKDKILKQLALGLSERKIADFYGCSRTVISNIKREYS